MITCAILMYGNFDPYISEFIVIDSGMIVQLPLLKMKGLPMIGK